jgi:uncharacterized membrane protein
MARTTQIDTIRHSRFWEIDLLRTIAIVGMITFHTLDLLYYFDLYPTNMLYGPWWWWTRAVNAGLFIFLAGVAITITYSRGGKTSGFMLRGLKIFGWGMALTLITLLISRTEYIRFGILHFFGIAFILAPFFLRFRFINLILGIALLVLRIYLQKQGVFVDIPWLLWLVPYHGFSAFDYWPLVPYFGLFLVGMFFGKILYPQGNRRFNIHEFNDPVTLALTFPGRHPLVIYLAQWPAIIVILLLLFPANVLPHFPF